MHEYQKSFIEFALRHEVLCFGEFVLKSGRTSPYFFNSGLFNTGGQLSHLGQYYAQALLAEGLDYDMLYGPAYKGIPLVAAIGIALAEHHALDVPYCFNRKEAKDHGEGGVIVGAPIKGKVLIVDDVISAGTSVRESFDIISANGGEVAGVLIALDRQEKGKADKSAIDEIREQYDVPVISIVRLEHLISFLQQSSELKNHLQSVQDYREQYGTD